MEWRRWRRSSCPTIFCCSTLLLSLFCLTAQLPTHRSVNQKGGVDSLMMEPYSQVAEGASRRRALAGGPGSYPPRCTGKCGDCAPCDPVHVAVPPGSSPVTTEYYPEAWRCKCGNKLYMP
ncbi:EPIDERMAL PATTERNING FACTOR-like protein 4 [Zingiber officinale]|uniref:EPIDERMAL PATTERNING FACTOR-like protein 4 n=1 Tax=Zingiber officinale TaxID=94328 RepID=UPI001C4C222D|nr:EPIDERMAL PATTERNING FACTOR-like protein 4 [Zingiber officinale]XP_042434628.1 EPIDERMAL PATTERNING FACTOR-like protein 4 [Zingiber officinale]